MTRVIVQSLWWNGYSAWKWGQEMNYRIDLTQQDPTGHLRLCPWLFGQTYLEAHTSYFCVNSTPGSLSPFVRTNLLVFSIHRCLRMPLETLSITHYQISQSDLDSFSCSQRLFQLKHLDMRGTVLLLLDIMPLRVLLENLADTLQSLVFKDCRMNDSQLTVLIPALSHCSKLTKVSFYNNNFSMPILRDLLKHTANLNKLNVEQYPAPLECYDDLGVVSTELFVQLCAELMDTLRAVRQPKSISIATEICVRCHERCVYALQPWFCPCL